MERYNKAIAALVGSIATILFAAYGEQLGLPPTWPETITAAVTPLIVYLIPNRAAQPDPPPARLDNSLRVHPLAVLAAALLLFLAACTPGTGPGPAAPDPRAIQLSLCQGYARSLMALAGYRAAGRLTPEQVDQVDSYRPLFNASCAPGAEPDRSMMDAMEDALINMTLMQGDPA